MYGGFHSKEEMDFVAKALLEALGADTQVTPGMVDGKDYLLVRWGRVKPTEGGARGFVKGLVYGYRKGRDVGFEEALECEKGAASGRMSAAHPNPAASPQKGGEDV
jgi:hypothetical protein